MLHQLIFQGLTKRVQPQGPRQEQWSTSPLPKQRIETENRWASQDTILACIMEISRFMEQRDGDNLCGSQGCTWCSGITPASHA
eukprot:6491486-Amphidinium_carterae.1